jgi:flagellar basal-body rod protein FlgG
MMEIMQIVAQSLSHDRDRLTSSALNFANAATPGYKRQWAAGVAFEQQMQAVEAGAGATAQTVRLDMRPGPEQYTGRALDLALTVKDAFFEFSRDQKKLYGRAASLHVDAQGRLVNPQGDAIMGRGGEIRLQTTEPVIDRQGNIYEAGRFVDRLSIVTFGQPERLLPKGGGLFEEAAERAGEMPQAVSTVLQRYLEGSNVDPVREMVHVIEVMRHFESLQKSAQISDEMIGRAVQKLSET